MDQLFIVFGQAFRVKILWYRGSNSPHYTQDWNYEMVTVMESITADSRVLSAMQICKCGKSLLGCHAGVQDNAQAIFPWSTKDWTYNELGLEWVKQNFDNYTIKMFVPWDWPSAHANYYSAKGKVCILILNGHGSYPQWQFFDFYLKRSGYPICFPAHSIHIFQYLDVELFGPPFCCYRNELDISVRNVGNAIKTIQFSK